MRRIVVAIGLSAVATIAVYVGLYMVVLSLMGQNQNADLANQHVWVIASSIVLLGLAYWIRERRRHHEVWYLALVSVCFVGGVLGTLVTGNEDWGIVGNFFTWTGMLYRWK